MINLFFVSLINILFFSIDNSFLRFILSLLLLIFLLDYLIFLINNNRWYTFLTILFFYIVAIYSSFIALFLNDLQLNPALFIEDNFNNDYVKLSQEISNLALLIFFIFSKYIVKSKKSFLNKFKKISKVEIDNKINKLYSRLIKFSSGKTLLFHGLIFLIILTIHLTNPTILDIQYPFQKSAQYIAGSSITFIPLFSLIFLWISIKRNFIFNLVNYFLFFIVSSLFLLHIGSRGIVAVLFAGHTILVTLHFLELIRKKIKFNISNLTNLILGLFSLLVSIFISLGFPLLRGTLASDLENKTLLSFWQSCFNLSDVFYELKPLYELTGLTLGPLNLEFHISIGEAYGQMVNVIDLLKSGNSRGFQTFLNLIPQSLPSFFDGILYTRPISDSEYLLDFVRTGGGFLLHANLFWNNGYIGLIIGLVILIITTYYIDNIFLTANSIQLGLYLFILPIFVVQFFYGFQGLVRCIEIILLSSLLNFKKINL